MMTEIYNLNNEKFKKRVKELPAEFVEARDNEAEFRAGILKANLGRSHGTNLKDEATVKAMMFWQDHLENAFKLGATFGFNYGDSMKEKDAEAYRKLGDENYKLFDENRKLKKREKLLLDAFKEMDNLISLRRVGANTDDYWPVLKEAIQKYEE